MKLYSFRHRRKIFKWNSHGTNSPNMPLMKFDMVDHARFGKNYEILPTPFSQKKKLVLIVHGRGAKPKNLRRFFGGFEGLTGDFDLRGFTWPSRSSLNMYPRARLNSYQASEALAYLIRCLRGQYEEIVVIGHSLGGNIVNNCTAKMVGSMVDKVILLSPDILMSDWNPSLGVETHLYVLPTDTSLLLSYGNQRKTKEMRIGRVGAPSTVGTKQYNVLDITKDPKFGHDSYPHDQDILNHVKSII